MFTHLTGKTVSQAICIMTMMIVGVALGYAQQGNKARDSSDEVRLPRLFSKFSQNDVLAAVFPDFDRTSGRVIHILNGEQKPSLVRLDQVRLWRSGGKDYLVVMVDIGVYDEQFGTQGLCGNCASASPIAVLRQNGTRLELVAKQEDDFYESQDGEDHSTGFESFWYTGHDFDVSFDLAPYRLSPQEMLIGVRYQHMWIPALSYSTTLLLYRIDGNRIKKVFGELVVDRDWKNGAMRQLPMEKTVSTIAMVPTDGPFNRLVATKRTYKCLANWQEMDCKGGRLYKTNKETWQFDGTVFVTTRKP